MKTKYLFLLLCLTVGLSHAANDEIAGDANLFKKIGEKYYIVFTDVQMNWFAAVNLCQTYDSDLATINSETEMNDLNFYLTKNGHVGKYFWISGNDLADEGKFVSLTTGRAMIYSKFLPGQPDNYRDEDCLHLKAFNNVFYMNDQLCSDNGYPICEMRSAKINTQDTCENIPTNCAVKTLVLAYLNAEKTFTCK
ncbi:C-type lectin 37Db-like [Zeugodacus cucurbitae]|uniref:C-type lectin 37Db-like n=1 Tax=Zeugodacus cucurbitae TaxID=28588 RepID=UPI0023D95A8F|nr:C-type lectin 37Db-like [Zeugodacus cucurbitae]